MEKRQTHSAYGDAVLKRETREMTTLSDLFRSTDDQPQIVQRLRPERTRTLLNIALAAATILTLLFTPFGHDSVIAQKKTTSAPKKAKVKKSDKGDDEPDTEGLKPFETGIDYKPTSPNKRITFNLEDADLPELVRLISQITGRRFIISSKARSIKATVYAPTKVTVAEAYQAFLSILELNGMALVRSGQYYKIVESGGIENRPIDLLTDDGSIPRGDRYLTRLHHLDNIPSDDAAGVLSRFKSGDGNVTSYAPTNTLIITDTGTNINRMMRILKVIDIPHSSENIWIEPVFHADATEIAQRLTEVFEAASSKKGSSASKAPAKKGKKDSEPVSIGSKSGDSHITKILADERTNSLIIMATEAAYLRILDMLRHLDIAMEGEGNIRVHYLQHSDAEEIAGTLSKLVTQKSSKSAKGAKEAVTVFEGEIAITAHKSSNALVITSSARDYASLRKTIDELDVKRRQVFIEAVIMELDVKRNSSLGVSYHGGVANFPADDSISVVGFQPGDLKSVGGLANPTLLTGLAVGVQGPSIDVPGLEGVSIPGFGVLLNAVAGSSDANILSTPHLIATDNVEAEISIGSNEPLQTSALANFSGLGNMAGLFGGGQATAGAAGAANLLASLGGGYGGSVPRQDVGTTIKLTPHINDSDEIRLEIAEEISSVGAPDNSGNIGVKSVSRTRAKTEVSVADQQTVVIGGLMRDSVSTGQDKVPILGDVPLIGVLFRSSSKDKVKKNLVLFLTPYIIRSADDLRAIYERKMRERQEFIDRYMVASGKEYDAPVDYSRTRGLVSEMIKEVKLLDERRQLLRDAEAAPPKEHAPGEAIGTVIDSGGSSSDESSEQGESTDATTNDQQESPSQQAVPPQIPFQTPPQFRPGSPLPTPAGAAPPEPEEPE